ncbi:MAG: sigma-70 family RNA polymerase sigma factor [Myxococcota bacterium]
MSAIARDEEATEALARKLRGGDRAAMQVAFAEHAPGVARTVKALACRAGTTEDLVQEVFVVAFTRIETYEGRVPLAAWLHGIAVNVVRNQRRRDRRRGELRERFEPAARERPDTPEEVLATRRLADQLWNAVDALGDRQREAFVLRVLEERSLAECAQVLGISIKSVSRRAVAAERSVRARLAAASGGQR